MDPEGVLSALMAMITASAKFSQQAGENIANRSQNSLNVLEDILLLSLGGPNDDSGLIAALQTAAGVPTQGGAGQK